MSRHRIYPFFLPEAGCPQTCRYCDQRLVSGRLRAVSVAQVSESLAALPADVQVEVAFYGGSFTFLPSDIQYAYLATVKPFLDSGKVVGVRVSTRPDGLKTGQLDLLRAAGVQTVEVGCQSFSDKVLIQAGRGYSAADATEGLGRLKDYGFSCGLQLMPGLPGGDAAEAHASLATGLRIGVDFLRLYPTVVLPGTDLAEDYRTGKYAPLSLSAAVGLCAELLLRAELAAVPLIRCGIPHEGSPDIAERCLAGPIHPAFGQLVRSESWRLLLQPFILPSTRTLKVSIAEFADLVGHKTVLRQLFQKCAPQLVIRPDPALAMGDLIIDGEPLRRRNLLRCWIGARHYAT